MMITDIAKKLPQIKGEFAIYMPVKKGINPNIFWMNGVSKDFITVFNNLLITKKLLQWQPEHLFTFIYLQAPIYSAKQLTNEKQLKTKEELWLPISITLKPEVNKKNVQLKSNYTKPKVNRKKIENKIKKKENKN